MPHAEERGRERTEQFVAGRIIDELDLRDTYPPSSMPQCVCEETFEAVPQ